MNELLGVTLVSAGLLAACGPGAEPADADVNGDYHETYTCEETCGDADPETLTGEVDMTLTANGADVTRVDDDGTTWAGVFAGQVINFSTSDGDYSEESSFTIDELNEDNTVQSFTIESQYTFGNCTGACTGDVVRE
jgi:hypothetical protein